MTHTAKVLDVLRRFSGPMTAAEIKERLDDVKKHCVDSALLQLLGRGAIKRLGRGVYTLTTGRPHCPHCGGDLG